MLRPTLRRQHGREADKVREYGPGRIEIHCQPMAEDILRITARFLSA